MSRKPRTVRGRNERARGRTKTKTSTGRGRPPPSAAERGAARSRPSPQSLAHARGHAKVQPQRDDARVRPQRDNAKVQPQRDDARVRPQRDDPRARTRNNDARSRDDAKLRAQRDPDQSEPVIDPALLHSALSRHEPLRAGEWLWTMREGAERDLIEELLLRDRDARPRKLAPALVASARAPVDGDSRLDVTFARQGFQVEQVVRAESIEALASALSQAIALRLHDAPRYALQLFVPDSELANPLAHRAEQLDALLALPATSERIPDSELRRHGGLLLQICLF
ncbi:MAG TPA: hypothetical protein VHZ95_11225, partial [Polyangiales bacterium]|nr:hypothetical protein [Polyangiales bacterium]